MLKPKAILMTVALCFIGAALVVAENPHMGTWKLNRAKSDLGPGAPKNNTVVYEAAGDKVKVTVDGIDSERAWAKAFGLGSILTCGRRRSDA